MRTSNAVTIGMAGIAHVYSHMFVLFYATVVLVLEREWGLGYAELIALSIPSSILFGVCALPAGWLGDRWSETGMLTVFFLGVGAASIVTGLAGNPLQIAIGLGLIGVFASIYHPVGIAWLVKHASNPARALGINGVFGSIGTAGAAGVAGFLAEGFGWRAAFVVPGIVCLVTGLAFMAAVRRQAVGNRADDAAAVDAEPTGRERARAFGSLALLVLCAGLIYQVMATAMPKLFAERLTDWVGDNAAMIGGLVTICWLVGAAGPLIGGELAGRWRIRNLYLALLAIQILVAGIAYFLVHPALVPAVAMIVGLNTAGQPAENLLLARYTPVRWRGRMFGFKFVLTLGVSSLGVALVPAIHSLTGRLDLVPVAIGVFAGLALLSALGLPDERRRMVSQAAE